MVKLTETVIYNRTKSAIENVKRLNLWGCDVDDISICVKMPNLEVLSLSVNQISTLEPLAKCESLQELYLRKNNIESLKEIEHLKGLAKLSILWLEENPCASTPDYRRKVLRVLPKLTSLDNAAVTKEEVEDALATPPTVVHRSSPSHTAAVLGRHLSTDLMSASVDEVMMVRQHQQALLSSSMHEPVMPHYLDSSAPPSQYHYTPALQPGESLVEYTPTTPHVEEYYQPRYDDHRHDEQREQDAEDETELDERSTTPIAELSEQGVYYSSTGGVDGSRESPPPSSMMSSSMYVDAVPLLDCVTEEDHQHHQQQQLHQQQQQVSSPRSVVVINARDHHTTRGGAHQPASARSAPPVNMDMSSSWSEFSFDDLMSAPEHLYHQQMAHQQQQLPHSMSQSYHPGAVSVGVPLRAQSVYGEPGARVAHTSRASCPPGSVVYQRTSRHQPRSSTLPRSMPAAAARRTTTAPSPRSPSKVRMGNILVAVNSLLDELDQTSLRTVIDEAQKRIKKQH